MTTRLPTRTLVFFCLAACGASAAPVAVPVAMETPASEPPHTQSWSFMLPDNSNVSTEIIGFGRDSVFAAITDADGETWKLYGATARNRWTIDVQRVALDDNFQFLGEGPSACEGAAYCEPAYLMPRLVRYDRAGDTIFYVDGRSRVIAVDAQTGQELFAAPLGEDLYPIAMATSEGGLALLATHGDVVYRVDLDRDRCEQECTFTTAILQLERAEDQVVHAVAEFGLDGSLIIATPTTLARFADDGSRIAMVRVPTEYLSVVSPTGDGLVAFGSTQATLWTGVSCDDSSCIRALATPEDTASVLRYTSGEPLETASWWPVPEAYEGAPGRSFDATRVVARELDNPVRFHVLRADNGDELGTFEAAVEDGLLTTIDMGDRVGVVALPAGQEPIIIYVIPMPASLQAPARVPVYDDMMTR